MKRIVLVVLLSLLVTGCRSMNCTGVCEVYEAQIEIANRDATALADRAEMNRITTEARSAMDRGDWSAAQSLVGDLRCAAGLGSQAHRDFWCSKSSAR